MNTRVKTSTVLKDAYEQIRSKSENYICIAVESYDFEELPEVKRALRLIHSRMQMGRFEKWVDKHRTIARHNWEDPYYRCETSLEWWLVWKGYVKLKDIPDGDSKVMREYRLAWLNALIQECEAKGD